MAEQRAMTTMQEAPLPANYDELQGMARAFVASGMFGDTKALAQAIVKIQAGRELGLPPVYSMQNIYMLKGRLIASANVFAVLIRKSGRYNYRIKEHTDERCSITFFERDGDKWAEVGVSTFTMDDARRAQLVRPGGSWETYPRAMLFSRAISQGARIYTPDAIGGAYTDEEIRSLPTMEQEGTIPEAPPAAATPPPADAGELAGQGKAAPVPSPCPTPEEVRRGVGVQDPLPPRSSPAAAPRPDDGFPMTDPQKRAIIATAKKAQFTDSDLADIVKRRFGIDDWNKMTVGQARSIISDIQRIEGPPPKEAA